MDLIESRSVVAIRLDEIGNKGVISQVLNDRGLRTVVKFGPGDRHFAFGELNERRAEASRIAEESGLTLIVIEHRLTQGEEASLPTPSGV